MILPIAGSSTLAIAFPAGPKGGNSSVSAVMSDEAHHDDRFATDAGIDGAAASAEEAAMHVIDEDDER